MTATLIDDGRRPLPAGARLGAYEVVRRVATGGMGDIYLARDTRLQRKVAIKVLPAVFGNDRERIRRFEQEIRATARLNHSNIISIYDVGESGETPYFVTEMLEGETLRSRLDRGALSVSQTIAIAAQICRGLAAAHAQAIVHRDLKPANVFIVRDEQVKILDFGVAKIAHADRELAADDEDTVSGIDDAGKIVGTAGYMSPEQVQGAGADARSDIFALGAMMYEMLTGQRAFRRDSPVETMHAILKDEPRDLGTVRRDVPRRLAAIVERCLAKQAAARFQTADDLLFALTLVSADQTHGGRVSHALLRTAKRSVPWLLSLVGLVVLGVGVRALLLRHATVPPFVATTLTGNENFGSGALSPDRRFFAYTRFARTRSIRLRHLATGNEIELVPPVKAVIVGLTFSPDGNYLYYQQSLPEKLDTSTYDSSTPPVHAINRVSILGGPPVTLTRLASPPMGMALSPDGRQLALSLQDFWPKKSVIATMSTTGGPLHPIAKFDAPALVAWIDWSPDGGTLAGAVREGASPWNLVAIDVASGRSRFFWRRDSSEIPHSLSWLKDGTALVASTSKRRLMWIRYPDGEVRPVESAARFSSCKIMGDRMLAAVSTANETNLWSFDVRSGSGARITSTLDSDDGRQGIAPLADGRIVFTSAAEEGGGRRSSIWICDADGSRRRSIASAAFPKYLVDPVIAPKANAVVFTESDGDPRMALTSRIVRVSLDTGARLVLTTSRSASQPVVTNDERSVIFVRGTTGRREGVWRVPFEGGDETQISTMPCTSVAIDETGRRLLCHLPAQIVVLPVAGGDPLLKVPVSLRNDHVRWVPGSNAFSYLDDTYGITIYDIDSQRSSKLPVPDDFENADFAWTPDGQKVIVSRRMQLRSVSLLTDVRWPGR